RTCEPRPLAQDGQIRPAPPVGAVNLGPGRRIVLQDSPHGVSRLGSQAGTQAPDPTPVSAQNRESRAGSTIHSLPAESERMASISITPMSARRLSLLYPEMRVAAAPVGRTFACVCSLVVMLRA